MFSCELLKLAPNWPHSGKEKVLEKAMQTNGENTTEQKKVKFIIHRREDAMYLFILIHEKTMRRNRENTREQN